MTLHSTLNSKLFILQKFNARVLYLAQCKIDGSRPSGVLGFADELTHSILRLSFISYIPIMFSYHHAYR